MKIGMGLLKVFIFCPKLGKWCRSERTPYLFNGKELDEETGLYYYGARYYDARTSVWQSVDPKGEEFAGWSPYNYTLNNPVVFVDPDGEKPTPREAAYLANHVYSGEGKLIGGWTLSTRKIEGVNYSNSNTGFKSSLYERTADGKPEYSYVTAGTDMTSSADWGNNARQVLSGDAPQYKQSTENAQAFSEGLEDSELTFVGHSLGGGLASANALTTGNDAITFNAAGLSAKTKASLNNMDSQIDAYVVKGEIVDFLQSKVGIKAEGTRHTLDAKYVPQIPGIKVDDKIRTVQRVINHMMGTVIDKLEQK